MSLCEVLGRRGYTFRQHLEEASWTERKPTVVDLDPGQCEALERGGVNGLKDALDRQGRWSFPALDIQKPLPRRPDVVLHRHGRGTATVVAPEGDPGLTRMAQELADAIRERHGVSLPLLLDDAARTDLLESQHLILFGGSHQNRLALDLALRYQTLFVDAGVPGEGGWVVTTHCGLHASGHNVVQATASPEHRVTAMGCLLNALTAREDGLVLRHTHRIAPGAVMAAHFPSWEAFVSDLPGRLPQLKGRAIQAPQDPSALADLLAAGLDSGGVEKNFYNVAPVDIAILCANYYQCSADPRALCLFRELLFRLADYYLRTPGGASYPADLDFRLGLLVLHYARLEHEPVFSEDDRLILANLLLACARSIHEYASRFWPAAADAPTRHNHETFPALSLARCADYFSRLGVPDVEAWRQYASRVFSGPLWRRYKQRENANRYELFVFEHGAAYSALTGRGLDMFAEGCLNRAAERSMTATDNFFRLVDYGDAGLSMNPADPLLVRLLATREQGPIRWYASEGFSRHPDFLPSPVLDLPGLRLGRAGSPPLVGDWECAPLEPMFLDERAPGFPRTLAFDKLAFRTGWGDDDQYLLFEGVGNQAVSHSHNDVNGIVRLNHLGRHWVVSNGYGRRVGVTNVAESFATRIRGPEDHNMLVLRREGQVVRDLPVCSALLQRGRQGPVLYATGALAEYGGVDWFRTLVVLAGRYVLVVDRVMVTQAGLESAHVEWNCLGEPRPRPNGFRLEQKGVFLDVTSASGWRAEQEVADRSACWKGVLDEGGYPYTAFPLRKLVYHMPPPETGRGYCLATLLSATRSGPDYELAQPEPGCVIIEGPHDRQGLRVEDGDMAILVEPGRCEVRFAASPSVSSEWEKWRADSGARRPH